MAILMLEDNTIFEGEWIGAKNTVIGEVVFNTGMTGYQEVLTDPSYYGQIVTMTYPLIGNYGINDMDVESSRPQVKAFVVREFCDLPNNWANAGKLEDYLEKNGIVGLYGIDTRALTRIIRDRSTMRGIISESYPTEEQILEMKSYSIQDAVKNVTCSKVYKVEGNGPHVAVLDLGMKRNILNSLAKRGCKLTVFPAHSTADDIMSHKPDAVFLSNGPGNPKDNPEVIKTVKDLLGEKPMFGICLGHQIMALAAGADTYRLKYGHRGCNHPVKDLIRDRIYITSQNHGYVVSEDGLPPECEITYLNWNDKTIEGLRYNGLAAASVQFHPEGSPGPKDSGHIFDEFIASID